jgi:hypothetical protein
MPWSLDDHVDLFRRFLKHNNQIWFVGCDITYSLFNPGMQHFIQRLDGMTESSDMVLFLDAEPTDRCYLSKLKNIMICVSPVNLFNRGLPRVQAHTLPKSDAKHDFLLTTIQKPDRPHRRVLWNQLNQRPRLLDHGLVKYHTDHNKINWIGRQTHRHGWQDGHASMDLYSQCWLEIVPESCYRNLYLFTEKTQKPIMTRTPFLMVSTAGYLEWLRQHGFQTFHSLIEEKYDQHYRIEDRVRGMVDVLEHIVHNGAEEFYRASQPILDHNFSRLCEIAGAWQWQFDQVMWRALEKSKLRP